MNNIVATLPDPSEVVLWGATGQARVVRPILDAAGYRVVRIFDNAPGVQSPFSDIPLGGNWYDFTKWRAANQGDFGFVVCIGGIRGVDRSSISADLVRHGLVALSPIHSRAWIAESAFISAGTQIMAMAAVGENVVVKEYCIINTNATVDHDCQLGKGVHVMPGATVAGEVKIGSFAAVGSNATILPRLHIGERAVIGAGAVVTRDVSDGEIVVGCPARPFKKERIIRQ
jgi:sugar O-acyltransferase (sialic acid O-acetyltransferase NeuD family)